VLFLKKRGNLLLLVRALDFEVSILLFEVMDLVVSLLYYELQFFLVVDVFFSLLLMGLHGLLLRIFKTIDLFLKKIHALLLVLDNGSQLADRDGLLLLQLGDPLLSLYQRGNKRLDLRNHLLLLHVVRVNSTASAIIVVVPVAGLLLHVLVLLG